MKWFLIAAALVLLPCSAPAQTDSLTASSHPNSLRAGAWALQFDVNGQVFSVESFTGGVSLKRQFSPKWALRFGVGINGGDSSNDATGDFDFGEDASSYGASIETVYQRYLNPGSIINAYWGLGPIASASRRTSERVNGVSHNEVRDTRWTAGAIASFGAEWFFATQFSLHGEYTGSGYYARTTSELKRTNDGDVTDYRKEESKGWSAGTSNNVRLGLSVYF